MNLDDLPILTEANAGDDPIPLFAKWYADAQAASVVQPEAMTLATASPGGIPSARVVLLRGFDEHGFVFYTNYESRKAKELEANPHAALVWHWKPLLRQVRVEGTVLRVSAEESDAYFRSRPRGSQIGAVASPQSQMIAGRAELDQRFTELENRYAGDIPRPGHWGGYRVQPSVVEFWQYRDDRLHDRFRFHHIENNRWRRERLAP